jgi:type IV fimbrial biogenesis protein FimT
MNREPSFPHRQADAERGFTLVELAVTLSIAAFLTMIAIPSFMYTTTSYRGSQQTGDLLADLQFARAQAIMEGQPVTVCISSDAATCLTSATTWQSGWIVFSDVNNDQTVETGDVIKRTHAALAGNNTLSATGSAVAVTFNREGYITGLPAAGLTFTLHDPNSVSSLTRCVALSAMGRVVAQTSGTGACS